MKDKPVIDGSIDVLEKDTGNKHELLVINNQVLRKIKIAVKSDVKNWAYISLR